MTKVENLKGTLIQMGMILILLGGSLFIDYKLTNHFLIKMGFDALSFFQVLMIGSFLSLMVGAQRHIDPMLDFMKEERRKTMSVDVVVANGYKMIRAMFIGHVIAALVYFYLIIPHFFKG